MVEFTRLLLCKLTRHALCISLFSASMAVAVHHHWSYISKNDLGEVIDRSMVILGYTACKPEQKDAAKSVLYGKDVFVSVPTGLWQISHIPNVAHLC